MELLTTFLTGSLEEKFKKLYEVIALHTMCSQNATADLRKSLYRFKFTFKSKWAEAHRSRVRFIYKNRNWLEDSIDFKDFNTTREAN